MKILHSTALTFAFHASFISACASTPGAEPHDMSAAHHEAMAANEDAEAKVHAERHDPDADVAVQRCSGHQRIEDGACWTSITNPTAEHLTEAKKHQKMAADHRAASQALREAEAKACVGIADADRDVSPFDHREDIARVEPLLAKSAVAKGQQATTTTAGATITFRAIPRMTAPWLQRIVDCHVARNASLGHDVPEMSYCPLVPKGVTAEVSAADGVLSVAVRSDDPVAANEVLSRARALVAH